MKKKGIKSSTTNGDSAHTIHPPTAPYAKPYVLGSNHTCVSGVTEPSMAHATTMKWNVISES